MKIWASCACILNSKLAASGPIWLKFSQIVVRWFTYKSVSANFNSSFHFKAIAYFSLAVAMISHPRIYLLIKMKRRHILEIWDTVFQANVWRNEIRINRFLSFVFGERGTLMNETSYFCKTSSFFKHIKVLYLCCNHGYSAFKKYMVCRGLCWNRERENDPLTDGSSGLADTLSSNVTTLII